MWGGDSDSALDDALGYLPADAPAAVAISTDLESDSYAELDTALQRFGLEGGIDGALGDLTELGGGVSFEGDVRPLLGEDLVIGVSSFDGLELDEGFVAALPVADADAAQELLAGIDGFEETEEIDGATVYGPAPPDVPEGVDLGDYDSTGQPHRTSSRGQT